MPSARPRHRTLYSQEEGMGQDHFPHDMASVFNHIPQHYVPAQRYRSPIQSDVLIAPTSSAATLPALTK